MTVGIEVCPFDGICSGEFLGFHDSSLLLIGFGLDYTPAVEIQINKA
jgi:hypothetical protein